MRPAVSPAAAGPDLSFGAPASLATWRRMGCRWPGRLPRPGTRCGIRDKATRRGSLLAQQLAPIWLPRMLRNVAARTPRMSSGEPVRQPTAPARPPRGPQPGISPGTQNRTISTADRLPTRAASCARNRHSPANASCSSA